MEKKFIEVKQITYPKAEVEVLKWWQAQRIFEKSITSREDGIPFTFYEGPPTANGKPGIHHVLSRTVKDLFCRYRTLKGFKVERKAGWDTHGLPVEIEVEKELGLKGRSQVEEYGIAAYNAKCRESVLKYKDLWDQLTTRMGYWVDLDNPYVTFENDYIESVWWALKTLYEKGLLYKGYKIQWYSPGSGTVLSSHEVSLGYQEVQDPSVFVKFPVKGEKAYFLAWTTTPWTLISNMALTVREDFDYAYIHLTDSGEILILATELIDAVIEEEYEIVRELKGKDLLGLHYQPLFEYALQEFNEDEAWRVISADFVTLKEGTGIVHTAPAFGADDYEAGKANGIPMYNPVDRDGYFVPEVDAFAGQWFKDADKGIIRDLKERGLLYKQKTYLHNYPHDWRKGTPLISYPVESWFIRTTAVRNRMVEINRKINWKPEGTGTGRFGAWLENNVDWAISRQRYWGTPIPIWVSDKDPAFVECIGSVSELRKKAGIPKDEELDLHRPYIDQITWPAPDGGTMRRIPDLLDVWFDSGSMPFAQRHYPFEDKEGFQEHFPADFIAEGVDQTRGWFYTLHALGTMLFNSPAFLNVVSNGLVLDAKGEKMSKSKNNAVDPFEVIRKFGADTVRWYMMSNSSPWENLKFSEEGLNEVQRRFFNTVVNTYSFFAMYANIDAFTYSEQPIPYADRAEMDHWIISRLFTTIKKVDVFFDEYEPTRAVREIEKLVEELSNWYVRRNRRRFWKEGSSRDKTAAYQTLYECLLTISKLMAPVAPFISEWLFQRLNEVTGEDEISVHLSFYPTVEETAINKQLERRMELARLISSMVLRIRNKMGINVRQPLSRMILPLYKDEERQAIESVKKIILDEVNVKKIEYVKDDTGIVEKVAKPNFPVLGKKMGSRMKKLIPEIQNLSSGQIDEFEHKGSISIALNGEAPVRLTNDDLEIVRSGLHGWSVETEDGMTVAVDTELTPGLIDEGLGREFINRIQNMRKEADFDVTDRIEAAFEGEDALTRAVKNQKEYISSQVLAVAIDQYDDQKVYDYTKKWDINGSECTLAIKRKPNPEG